MGLGSNIKIFAIPIYGKKPLKVFFSGLERLKTLDAALGTLALPGLFKCLPLVDLDLF